jgi:tRNA pseudouridine38-40 synthase
MSRTFLATLQFDGTRFVGWQRQPAGRSVQAELERVLERLFEHRAAAHAAGRTDAGVHALRYCANFKTDCTIPTDRIPLAVNALLPFDIAATDAVEAPEEFNSILSCIKKEYVYKLQNSRIRDPFLTSRAYFFPSVLNVDRMKAASKSVSLC